MRPKAAWQLDDDAILIASRQGYTGFYLANRDEDPPVMMFRDLDTATLWSEHFTTWLDDMIRSESEGLQALNAARAARVEPADHRPAWKHVDDRQHVLTSRRAFDRCSKVVRPKPLAPTTPQT